MEQGDYIKTIMKKVLFSLAAVALSFAMVSCGGNSSSNGNSTPEAPETIDDYAAIFQQQMKAEGMNLSIEQVKAMFGNDISVYQQAYQEMLEEMGQAAGDAYGAAEEYASEAYQAAEEYANDAYKAAEEYVNDAYKAAEEYTESAYNAAESAVEDAMKAAEDAMKAAMSGYSW